MATMRRRSMMDVMGDAQAAAAPPGAGVAAAAGEALGPAAGEALGPATGDAAEEAAGDATAPRAASAARLRAAPTATAAPTVTVTAAPIATAARTPGARVPDQMAPETRASRAVLEARTPGARVPDQIAPEIRASRAVPEARTSRRTRSPEERQRMAEHSARIRAMQQSGGALSENSLLRNSKNEDGFNILNRLFNIPAAGYKKNNIIKFLSYSLKEVDDGVVAFNDSNINDFAESEFEKIALSKYSNEMSKENNENCITMFIYCMCIYIGHANAHYNIFTDYFLKSERDENSIFWKLINTLFHIRVIPEFDEFMEIVDWKSTDYMVNLIPKLPKYISKYNDGTNIQPLNTMDLCYFYLCGVGINYADIDEVIINDANIDVLLNLNLNLNYQLIISTQLKEKMAKKTKVASTASLTSIFNTVVNMNSDTVFYRDNTGLFTLDEKGNRNAYDPNTVEESCGGTGLNFEGARRGECTKVVYECLMNGDARGLVDALNEFGVDNGELFKVDKIDSNNARKINPKIIKQILKQLKFKRLEGSSGNYKVISVDNWKSRLATSTDEEQAIHKSCESLNTASGGNFYKWLTSIVNFLNANPVLINEDLKLVPVSKHGKSGKTKEVTNEYLRALGKKRFACKPHLAGGSYDAHLLSIGTSSPIFNSQQQIRPSPFLNVKYSNNTSEIMSGGANIKCDKTNGSKHVAADTYQNLLNDTLNRLKSAKRSLKADELNAFNNEIESIRKSETRINDLRGMLDVIANVSQSYNNDECDMTESEKIGETISLKFIHNDSTAYKYLKDNELKIKRCIENNILHTNDKCRDIAVKIASLVTERTEEISVEL